MDGKQRGGAYIMARTSKKKQEIRKKPVKIYYVGIYARLSVDSGDRKNESIETQVEIIKAFIGSLCIRNSISIDCVPSWICFSS